MNKFSHYISEDNIRKIVSLKSGKTAVIPKNGRNEEEAPGILLFDNSLNLLAILDRNELFDGARLNVIELSDGRILTYGRSYYIKLWTSSGEFIEKWNNHFFTRGTIQLSGRRIVSTCGTSIVIREENGRNIKTVNASKSGWLPLRVLKNLSEDRFFTDDLCGEKHIWNKNGRKIKCLSEPNIKTEIHFIKPAKYPEICYFDEYGNRCCIENAGEKNELSD